MFIIKNIEGRGNGWIATKDIPKGTIINIEKALVLINKKKVPFKEIENVITNIYFKNEIIKKEYFELHDNQIKEGEEKTIKGIYLTNNMTIDDTYCGVFHHNALINHDCNPTCVWFFKKLQCYIISTKNIKKNQEITISYNILTYNKKKRQNHLLKNYKFNCSCKLCSSDLDNLRINKLLELQKKYLENYIQNNFIQGILENRTCIELILLMDLQYPIAKQIVGELLIFCNNDLIYNKYFPLYTELCNYFMESNKIPIKNKDKDVIGELTDICCAYCCKTDGKLLYCKICKIQYCSVECQKKAWSKHKKYCVPINKEN